MFPFLTFFGPTTSPLFFGFSSKSWAIPKLPPFQSLLPPPLYMPFMYRGRGFNSWEDLAVARCIEVPGAKVPHGKKVLVSGRKRGASRRMWSLTLSL